MLRAKRTTWRVGVAKKSPHPDLRYAQIDPPRASRGRDKESNLNFRHTHTFPQRLSAPGDAKFIRPKRAWGMPGANAPADGVTGLLALWVVVPHMMV